MQWGVVAEQVGEDVGEDRCYEHDDDSHEQPKEDFYHECYECADDPWPTVIS